MRLYSQKFIDLISSPQFVKYFISGLIAFSVDTGILLLLDDILVFNPVLIGTISGANVISTVFGFSTSYILNRNWSFKAKDQAIARQAGRFLLVNLFSYVVNNLVFGVLTIHLFVPLLAAKVMVTALQMLWNFLLYKFFVFRK